MSPLDWVNTRRTFEGYKLFWKGTDWDIDAFWTNPVGIEPTSLDSPNQDQEFMGIYSTYKGSESETIGFYYLRLINSRGTNDFQFDTLGTRWQGSHCDWLWEVEGAVQFGDNTAGSDHSAGFYTLGLGRKLPCWTWSPTLLVYYDWASGDDTQFNGYDHLFSLAHKYNGFMDLFGRRNLEDTNVLLALQPNPKTRLLMWYHLFYLQDGNDIPYSVAMGALAGECGANHTRRQPISGTRAGPAGVV